MPNWKKLIVSGSNAALNTVTASVFLSTGSGVGFIGTASWAQSASWAPGATPGSPLNSIQFNSGSTFGGSANYTFISSSNSLYLTGSLIVTGSATASKAIISSSGNQQLKVAGSGSSNPIMGVYGSQGNLLIVNDTLSGSLFSVNDISAFTIFEVFSDKTVTIGDSNAPGLYSSILFNIGSSGPFKVLGVPSSSYNGLFVEYTATSGSNARAGNLMSIVNGSSVKYTETTTTDFGDTSGLKFLIAVSQSFIVLSGSASTSNWTIKSIYRAI